MKHCKFQNARLAITMRQHRDSFEKLHNHPSASILSVPKIYEHYSTANDCGVAHWEIYATRIAALLATWELLDSL